MQNVAMIVLLLPVVTVDLLLCLMHKVNFPKGAHIGKHTVCTGFGTICDFRPPPGVLEHTLQIRGGLPSVGLTREHAQGSPGKLVKGVASIHTSGSVGGSGVTLLTSMLGDSLQAVVSPV